MNYFLLIIILLIPFIHEVNSQDADRFDLFSGYGFYEGINVGAMYNFRSISHSAGLSFGCDKIFNKKERYFAITGEYKIAIFRKSVNKLDKYKWHLNGRAVFWYLEDEYYIWKAVSFIPSLSRYFSMGKKIGISADAGPSFNLVLYNHRKTFREVGWPYHVLPNMRVVVIF